MGSRKTNIKGGLSKKGAWTVSRFKGEELGKKEGVVVVFLRGQGVTHYVLTNRYY